MHMDRSIVCFVSILFASTAAIGQTAKPGLSPEQQRAKQKCEANHGVDCNSSEGLKEWVEQDRPMTAEQQRAAAAARLKREQCAKNKNC